MAYENYTTFKAKKDGAILTVTFDYPPVNVQGIPMLDDLNQLAESLESDRRIKVMDMDHTLEHLAEKVLPHLHKNPIKQKVS